jgi:hypothetical protein
VDINLKGPMTPRERLTNARSCIADGRYAEALLDLVWFHENALDPSWTGVRRSYALDEWVRLGNVYPPALTALDDTRDQKAAALLQGELNESAFRDVASIDGYRDSVSRTYSLYLELLKKQPELAKRCAQAALWSIVAAEDYQLAAQLTPDPEALVRRKSGELNLDVRLLKYDSYTRAPTRWAYVCNYVQDIQELLKIKVGINEHVEAARLKSLAIALIESPSLRREVQAGFVKRARARVPRR